MTLLPIVARELRVAARKPSTYWGRWFSAMIAIAIFGFTFLVLMEGSQRQMGKHLFATLGGLALLYALFAGLHFTSDCISQEKREGTLGFLFLTDLRGYDVALGKLAATSLNGLYGLVAVAPVMAVPVLMGGLTLAEVGRVMMVLLNALFFSVSAGLLCSALSRNARKAYTSTFLTLAAFVLIMPLLGGLYQMRFNQELMVFFIPSPFFAFGTGLEPAFSRMSDYFWQSVTITHAFAWIFVLSASLVAPRLWQDRPAGARAVKFQEKWNRWTYGSPSQRAAFRREMLDVNPILWLSGRDRFRAATVWAVLGLIAAGWFWGAAELGQEWFEDYIYLMTALALNTLMKIWLASESCRRFNEDRQSGALELLLCAPLKLKEIFQGQLLAMRKIFGGPVLAVLAVDFLMLIAGMRSISGFDDRMLWFWIFVCGLVIFLLDLAAIAWLGMWIGLTSRNANQAVGGVVSRILVLPWILFVCTFFLQAIRAFRNSFPDSEFFFLFLWFGYSLAISIGFLFYARGELYRRFRALATTRGPEPRVSWIKRMFGGGKG